MTIKKPYKTPCCAFGSVDIDSLVCASEFASSVIEDVTVSEEFGW